MDMIQNSLLLAEVVQTILCLYVTILEVIDIIYIVWTRSTSLCMCYPNSYSPSKHTCQIFRWDSYNNYSMVDSIVHCMINIITLKRHFYACDKFMTLWICQNRPLDKLYLCILVFFYIVMYDAIKINVVKIYATCAWLT